MMVPGAVEIEYMDVATAGRYLGNLTVGPESPHYRKQLQRIYTMIYRKQIPYLKKGKRIFFSKRALDEWMQSSARAIAYAS